MEAEDDADNDAPDQKQVEDAKVGKLQQQETADLQPQNSQSVEERPAQPAAPPHGKAVLGRNASGDTFERLQNSRWARNPTSGNNWHASKQSGNTNSADWVQPATPAHVDAPNFTIRDYADTINKLAREV